MRYYMEYNIKIIFIILTCFRPCLANKKEIDFDLEFDKSHYEELLIKMNKEAEVDGELDFDYYTTRCHIYIVLERYEDALKDVLFMIKLNPDEPDLWLKAGTLYYYLRDKEEAYNYYKLYNSSDKMKDSFFYGRFASILYDLNKEMVECINLLEKAIEIDPFFMNKNPNYHTLKGTIYFKMGNIDRALETFRTGYKYIDNMLGVATLEEKKNIHLTILAHLGYLLMGTGQYIEAEEYIDEFLSLDDEYGMINNKLPMQLLKEVILFDRICGDDKYSSSFVGDILPMIYFGKGNIIKDVLNDIDRDFDFIFDKSYNKSDSDDNFHIIDIRKILERQFENELILQTKDYLSDIFIIHFFILADKYDMLILYFKFQYIFNNNIKQHYLFFHSILLLNNNNFDMSINYFLKFVKFYNISEDSHLMLEYLDLLKNSGIPKEEYINNYFYKNLKNVNLKKKIQSILNDNNVKDVIEDFYTEYLNHEYIKNGKNRDIWNYGIPCKIYEYFQKNETVREVVIFFYFIMLNSFIDKRFENFQNVTIFLLKDIFFLKYNNSNNNITNINPIIIKYTTYDNNNNNNKINTNKINNIIVSIIILLPCMLLTYICSRYILSQ